VTTPPADQPKQNILDRFKGKGTILDRFKGKGTILTPKAKREK